VVAPHDADPANVDAALAALRDDDRYRRSAREVAGEIAAMPAPDALVPRVETAALG
jgi:hypothetical protein